MALFLGRSRLRVWTPIPDAVRSVVPRSSPAVAQGPVSEDRGGCVPVAPALLGCAVPSRTRTHFHVVELALLFSRSVVSDSFVTPWTVARQAPLSMGFSRQEYWSGLPFPYPGDFPDPGIEPTSSASQADSLPLSPRGLVQNLHMLRPQTGGASSSSSLWAPPGLTRNSPPWLCLSTCPRAHGQRWRLTGALCLEHRGMWVSLSGPSPPQACSDLLPGCLAPEAAAWGFWPQLVPTFGPGSPDTDFHPSDVGWPLAWAQACWLQAVRLGFRE